MTGRVVIINGPSSVGKSTIAGGLQDALTEPWLKLSIDDFLGFTFAFIVTGLTFLLSCTDVGMRVGMTTGSLFAAVVNLNRLHDAAGFRPGFAMVDRLAFLVLGAIVGSLLITIFTHRMSKHDVQRANRIDTILGTGLLVVIGLLIVVTVGLEL